MSNFTLFHTNAVDEGIFSGGNWQPELPLENLHSLRTTKRARSVDSQLTSTQFNLQLLGSVTVRGIQVIATNLSAAGRYKITWYSDLTFTTEAGSTGFINVSTTIDWTDVAQWLDWLNVDFWLSALPFIDPDNQGRDIRHNFSAPTTVQYLKFEFEDQTNAKGYLEIGYLYVGRPFVPSINVDSNPSFSRVSMTSVAEAVGGTQFFNRRGSRKRLVVTWAMLPEEEVLVEIDELVRIQDIDRAVYVDLDPDNVASGYTTSFLARIRQLPETQLLDAYLEGAGTGTAATIGFEFVQVL